MNKKRLFILTSLTLCIALTCCIKVKRNFDVSLPGRPSSIQRSQNAVFELRNSALVQIPIADLNQILDEVRQDISGKEFVDTKSAEPKTSPFLGATLETSLDKSVVRICIDKLQLKTDGPSAMKMALTISSCGLKVDLFKARAVLRPQGKLSSKPIKLSIDHFIAKRTDFVKEFTLKFQLQTDDLGALQFSPDASLDGLEILSDPNSYDFQSDNSMDKDTLGSFDKTADQMSTQLITQILKVFQGYLANSMSDAFSRTFKKISERFNERGIGLKSRSWTAGFGDLSLFSILSLNGIVGDKSLAAVFSTDVQLIGDAMALTKYCHIDESGFFPDPAPNWLRGISLDPYLRSNSASATENQSSSQISIPVQTLNYVFWKAFGNSGTCDWKYPDNISKDLTISVRYAAPWRIRFSPSQDSQPLSSDRTSSVALQISPLRFVADVPFLDKVIQALKENGFANNADELRQLDYTLTAFEYPLQILIDRSKNILRFAVQNEEQYLAKDSSKVTDLVLDIVNQLRSKSEFAAAPLSLKKDLLVKTIISSVLSQNLAKKLHDAEIKLQNSIDQTKLVAQNIAVNEKSVQIFFSGQLGSINPPTGLSKIDAKSGLALLKTGPETELQEPVMPTSTLTIAEATSALSAIGIANVIGAKVEEGISRIQSLAKSKGSKCSTSGHISLPISEEAATIANYVTCYKDTTSVEYRIHTEKASLVNASPESPIVYVNISYQRPVTKDIQPTQSDGGAPTFDGFANGLRKPASDLVKEGFFVTNWTVDKWNVSILGFCSNMQSDASTCDNNKRIITGVRLWQN